MITFDEFAHSVVGKVLDDPYRDLNNTQSIKHTIHKIIGFDVDSKGKRYVMFDTDLDMVMSNGRRTICQRVLYITEWDYQNWIK